MPVCARKRGIKYRVIECDTGRIAKNSKGTALDGGGHNSKDKAQRQARAVNTNKHHK